MENRSHGLSEQAVKELEKIYQEEYDAALSEGEAEEMGHRLLRLFAILDKPTSEP